MARQPNPEGTNRKRTAEVRIKLSPAIAEGFGAVAERRGILPATLAAVVIGEYLEKQDESVKIQRLVAMDVSKRMAASASSSLDPAQSIAAFSALPESVQGQIFALYAEQEGTAGQAGSSAAPEAAAPMRGTSTGDRARSAT